MKSEFVRWTQWNELGMIASGYMRKIDVPEQLRRFVHQAKEALEETGADHVIYGAKLYTDNDLTEVRFYMLALDDEEFYRRTGAVKDSIIYALHRR